MGRNLMAWLWMIGLLLQPGVVLADGEPVGTDPANKVETYALSLDQAVQPNPAVAEGAVVAAAMTAENTTNLPSEGIQQSQTNDEQVSLGMDTPQRDIPNQQTDQGIPQQQATQVTLDQLPLIARAIYTATNAEEGLRYARIVLPGAGGDGSWIEIREGRGSVLYLKLAGGGLIIAAYENRISTQIYYRATPDSGWIVYRPAR